MKAHGVPWLMRHLNREISIEEATAGAIMDTRRYTKRQVTWFRNQMKDWLWETPESALSAIQARLSGHK
jgi:tRNA dimethylallyltransferase